VVLLFPGALGDLLLALPTLRQLRLRHAGAELVLAVDRRWRPLAALSGVADRVVSVDGVDLATTLGGGPAPSWWSDARHLYAWAGRADAETRRSLRRHAVRSTFMAVVRGPGRSHAAVDYAAAIGWRPTWGQLVEGATLRAEPAVARGRGVASPVLVVHRGAGSPAKRWDERGFAQVAAGWLARGGGVVDLRGPTDMDLGALAGAVVVSPSVADLPGLLAGAACFLGNDSGPAHVAAAMGVSGAVLFGPTRARRWRPVSNDVVAIEGEGGDTEPFARLDAERVLAAIEAMRP